MVTSNGESRLGFADLVQARADLDRLLRVGVDVLPQGQERVERGGLEVIQHDEARILGDELSRQHRLLLGAGGALAREGDDRVAQRPEVLLDGRAAQRASGRQRIGPASRARVEDQVLDALLGHLSASVGQRVQIAVRHAHGQRRRVLLGKGGHLLPVVGVRRA